jgi:hypothetical protein
VRVKRRSGNFEKRKEEKRKEGTNHNSILGKNFFGGKPFEFSSSLFFCLGAGEFSDEREREEERKKKRRQRVLLPLYEY